MRRVLVSGTTFKLSQAGYDAASAASANLIFDGFGGYAYNGVYLAGIVKAGGNSTTTIGFGKTFSAIPQCFVRPLDPVHSGGIAYSYLGSQSYPSGEQVTMSVAVTASSLAVTFAVGGSGGLPQAVGFAYIVMQV